MYKLEWWTPSLPLYSLHHSALNIYQENSLDGTPHRPSLASTNLNQFRIQSTVTSIPWATDQRGHRYWIHAVAYSIATVGRHCFELQRALQLRGDEKRSESGRTSSIGLINTASHPSLMRKHISLLSSMIANVVQHVPTNIRLAKLPKTGKITQRVF